MKRTSIFFTGVCGVLSAAAAHADFSVASVHMTNLGTLGGQSSEASDVNNGGTIVGNSTDSLGAPRAFYYTSGAMYQVGVSGAQGNWAAGINNSGHIVGTWSDSTGDHAWRWYGGLIVTLAEGPPVWQTVESSARAIAENGRIAGQLHYPHPTLLGFSASTLWNNTTNFIHLYPQNIPLEYASIVADVDELGRAVVWDNHLGKSYLVNHFGPPASTYKPVPDPPAIAGYTFSTISALGLHESNGVVGGAGYYSASNVYISRAYYWDTLSPSVNLLPKLYGGRRSAAEDINAQGLIAGWSDIFTGVTRASTALTAFIHHADFGIYALPRGDFDNCTGRALSDRSAQGYVIVVGTCEGNSGKRAIRWTVKIDGTPGRHI